MDIDNPKLREKQRIARETFPEGTLVRYYPTLGRPTSYDLVTVDAPWLLGSGEVLVRVAGPGAPTGGVSVQHLQVLDRPESALAYRAAVIRLCRAHDHWLTMPDAMPDNAMFAAIDELYALANVATNDGEGLTGDDGMPVPYRAPAPAFDAGLLGDGGGGDVEWWHTYIRSLLEQAHEHYAGGDE